MSHPSFSCRVRIAFFAVSLALPGHVTFAQDLTAPSLAAASNLSQGRQQGVLRLAKSLGVRDFRDGMRWAASEKSKGNYVFDDKRTTFPDELGRMGIRTSTVLNWGNPLYESGHTPTTAEGIEAFGAFAGALVARFPSIYRIEVGNEFNGVNYVKGPIAEMTALERARAYVPLLAATAKSARAVRPDIKISGGATHSIPAGYIWEILDSGGAEWMDSLAIHPYTTSAEQLTRQVEVLRRHPLAKDIPIEVTEFGHPDPAQAANHFVTNYCQMALTGMERVAWYPLNERGDNLVPLFSPEGRITSAGRAYKLIAARMEGKAVKNIAPDPFTYGCQFGDDVSVLWGEDRSVDVAEGTTVFDAQGNAVDAPYRLTTSAPLVFVKEGGGIAESVTLGESLMIADSYHQFAYPTADEFQAAGDAFERFARREGVDIPLMTYPGQERPGTPWFPYRGNVEKAGHSRLSADSLLPAGADAKAVDIVHRFTATEDMQITLLAEFKVPARSEDGIAVSVVLNGKTTFDAAGKDPIIVDDLTMTLKAGDQVEVIVGPNGSSDGDLTDYRISLMRAPS